MTGLVLFLMCPPFVAARRCLGDQVSRCDLSALHTSLRTLWCLIDSGLKIASHRRSRAELGGEESREMRERGDRFSRTASMNVGECSGNFDRMIRQAGREGRKKGRHGREGEERLSSFGEGAWESLSIEQGGAEQPCWRPLTRGDHAALTHESPGSAER
jgi:hypothetical protein